MRHDTVSRALRAGVGTVGHYGVTMGFEAEKLEKEMMTDVFQSRPRDCCDSRLTAEISDPRRLVVSYDRLEAVTSQFRWRCATTTT